MQVSLQHVSKSFSGTPALADISLAIESGQIACLLGPSGCGKTTALRVVAGFEQVDSGTVQLGNRIVCDAKSHVPASKRSVGMVFQDHALLPHLTVRENISLGLHQLSKADRNQRVQAVLELVGLTTLVARYPAELSGGQAQRVALARALAPEPDLVLLDEPFANLDVTLRQHLVVQVRDILKAAGTTALLVTHDQHEAFAMADTVGVMNAGRIEQWASPYDLYHRPANRFTAGFVGEGVLLPGQRDAQGVISTELGKLRGEAVGSTATDVDVLIRPDDLRVDAASPICGTVQRAAFRGAQTLYTVALASGATVLVLADSHEQLAIGAVTGLRLTTEHVVAFSRTTPAG